MEHKVGAVPEDITIMRCNALISFLEKKHIQIKEAFNGREKYLKINKDMTIETHIKILKGASVCSMGAFSYTNSELGYGVEVGRYSSIGRGLSIMGADHFTQWISTSPRFYNQDYASGDVELSHSFRNRRNIIIGNDVWIGGNVTLAKNLKVGDGAVIASHAVVTKDVPEYSVVGGVPAKVIRYRFDCDLIEEVKSVRWWQYHINHLRGMSADSPRKFIKQLAQKKLDGKIFPYRPEKLTVEDLALVVNSGGD